MQHAAQHAVSLDRGTASGVARVPSSFLWAAVDLPSLALEALHIGVNEYAVVTEPSCRGAVVYQASENARSVGIKPGMNVNAALAIRASLRVCPRDPDAECRHLHEFHHWAGRFTPTVSTEPPTTLLFEVAASLKLFDGIEALYDRLRRELDQTGHRCYLALTPTPGASSMLAAAGRETLITDMADLRMSMRALPLHSLRLARETLRRLRAAGVSSLEELWRLPRHDLTRRFGPDVVRKLDQALGMRPDPRRIDAIPDCFERHCELEAETVEAGFILQAARFLLEQFSDFLTARSAVASDVRVWLKHAGNPATRIDVGTRLPMRDAGQWERLLREHIQRRELRAPVRGIRLSGSGLWSGNPASGDLFETPDAVGDWARALDELEARWGDLYPIVIKSWRTKWDNLSAYFKYPQDIRRVIYTTNSIEAVHRQFRKLTKTKGGFPNEDSLMKLLYLGVQNASKKWTMPIQGWNITLSRLAIFFEGRLDGVLDL